jgi:hypothetical protein
MPIGAFLAYARSTRQTGMISSARWAMLAAALLTVPAGYLFQNATHQAGIEASLAVSAVFLTLWFGRSIRSETFRAPLVAVVAALTLILVRQTMEIEVVLRAALVELRSLDATIAVSSAVIAAALAALVWTLIARWLSADMVRRASLAFAAVFFLQSLVYAFHESAEARVLPWSEVLHTASEPYGPEGEYGRQVSFLLFVLPLLTVLTVRARDRVARLSLFGRRRFALASMVAAACVVLMTAVSGGARVAREAAPAVSSPTAMASITASPHLVFRYTGVDANYNLTKVAPLDRSDAGVSAGLRCERVSFGAGRGICLQADRGMFTTYKAVLFDKGFTPTSSIKLDGSPSRSRISRDGRVGAFTIFLTGHAYAPGGFSTQTMLVDMASGDPLGELEQFTTWRDGARFKASDFNFWGVTFTRDSNIFYASLGTGGKTYLLKGDLALRKLTVLAENVECPSVSPDDRLIVFKRRVGTAANAWRFYVMDLATMNARPLASETRFVDDQAEWLDSGHVLYAIQRPSSGTSDVWVAPIDDSTPAKIFASEASSPIVVR